MGQDNNEVPTYKGYHFESDERLEGDKFAYKLNKGTHRLFVSPALYEAIEDDFEGTIKSLNIKDLSDYAINEISSPTLQALKQYDTNEQIKEIESKSPAEAQRQKGESESAAEDNKIRLLIAITELHCDVDNSAPDFVDPELDELKVSPVLYDQEGKVLVSTGEEFPLEYEGYSIERQLRRYSLEESRMWFDLDLEKAKEAWLGNVQFVLKTEYARYLSYEIAEVQYQLQWMEKDGNTGSYRSLSMTKKVFKPQKYGEGETGTQGGFSKETVLDCARKLRYAINQIDLRTQAGHVKLEFEKEEQQELTSELAETLGYKLETLSDEDQKELSDGNPIPTHLITLK